MANARAQGSGYFAFPPRAGDNPWLDLVRTIAIALVLLRHGYHASAASQEVAPAFLHALAMNGWVGVDLFFVLSGYLISGHLLRAGFGTSRFVLWRYLATRALRIVPAYLAVMALIVAAAFPFYRIDPAHLGGRVAYHLLFLQDYLPSNINVVFWSLGVEEKFYLTAPLLVWLALVQKTLARALLVLSAIAALSPALRAWTYVQAAPADYVHFFQILRSPFHACLEPLVAGVAIAVAQATGAARSSGRAGRRHFAVALLLLAAWLMSHEFMRTIGAFDAVLQPVVIAGLCAFVTLAAVRMNGMAMRCEGLPRALARLSYALYLVHYPLVPLALAVSAAAAWPAAAFWLVYLVTALAAAALLHWAVEKPFLKLKDELLRRPAPRHAPLGRFAGCDNARAG
ncbi:MAG TPA: acyltransferase [Beijerinckiaceae bacterium]|nr:acyltransferase [Beijerinckiaceae bacterium]